MEYSRAVLIGISMLSTVDPRHVFQDPFMKSWLFDAAIGVDALAYDTTKGMPAPICNVHAVPAYQRTY